MKYRSDTEKRDNAGSFLLRMYWPVLAGTVLGSVLFALYPEESLWQAPLFRQGLGTTAAALHFWKLFLQVCAVPLLWLFFTAAAGTSLIGVPLNFCILLFRGIALGAVLCELYILQSAAGILTAFCFVVPCGLIGVLLLAAAAREGMRFASGLLRSVRGNGETPVSIRLYLLRFLVLGAAVLLISLAQCFLLRYGYPAFLDLMMGK